MRKAFFFLLAPLFALILIPAERPASAQAPNDQGPPLKRFVGSFDVSTKLYMQPGQPPMQTQATAVFKEIMGGRFVRQDYKDARMGVTGVGYFGYDPRSKAYSSVWMYNMSPKIEHSTGKLDKQGVLKLTGEGRAYENTWADADTRVLKSWAVRGDQKTLLYEMTYKRKK